MTVCQAIAMVHIYIYIYIHARCNVKLFITLRVILSDFGSFIITSYKHCSKVLEMNNKYFSLAEDKNNLRTVGNF